MRHLVFTCLLLLTTLLAQAQATRLRGTVRGPGGRPVAGALVSSPQARTAATTDSLGRFELQGRQALREVTVNQLGYRPLTARVPAGEDLLSLELLPSGDTDLGEAVVTSKYYHQYNTQTVSSALRIRTPLLQLAQDVQAVTPEAIFDQGSFNTTDGVARNVSGITRLEISNNLGPYLFMRGGQIAALRNGVDLTPIYRGPVPDDAAVIDRVEFIKGPSLFMNNIGDPAGSFNTVTKQPTGQPHYALTAMLGSYDLYRLAADLDGKLSKNGKLLYRFNAMGMTTSSFTKFDFNRRWLVAPVLHYRFGERTSLTAEYTYQWFRYGLYSPIVMTPNGFGSLPRDFSVSESSVPPIRVQDHSGFLTLRHDFSADWQLTARGAFLLDNTEGIYLWVTGVNKDQPNVLLRNPKYDLNRTQVVSEQAFVNGKFTTGPLTHQLLAGVDANQKKFLAASYVEYDKTAAGSLRYYPLDVTNPVYGAEIPDYSVPGGLAGRNTEQTITYVSAYALDEVALLGNKVRVTPGLRYTAVQTDNLVSGVVSNSRDRVFTPRLGVSYSVLPSLSVYGLYDRTLVPQAGVTSGGAAISPVEGSNRELGVKKNWLDGRWSSAVAVYYIKRSGIIATDPNNSLYRIQVGENHAQGVDVDVVGQLVRGLNVVINYAYNDSKIDADASATLVGARTPLYVKHIQNSWLNYELPARVARGLSFSLGYQYQAGRAGRYAVATPYVIPDYFRLDGGVGWQNKHLKVNLLVNNLLNHNLIAAPWLRNGLYYWVPQPGINGRLSASYTFKATSGMGLVVRATAAPLSPMLQAENLTKRYGSHLALDNLNLAIPAGEVYCLLGSNGAGKSTTINIFLGFMPASSGRALIDGLEVAVNNHATRALVAYIPEIVNLYPTLTGLENLAFFSGLSGFTYSRAELAAFTRTAGLQAGALDQRVGGYSKGMRQKVGIAIALAKQAKVLFLDEPTSGLDPHASNEFAQVIRQLSEQGVCTLMATHDLLMAKELGHRIGIMHQGRLRQELHADQVAYAELTDLYLSTVNQPA